MKPREKILIVSPQVPEFDKLSGWVRLHQIVEILARHYEVFFVAEYRHTGYTGIDDKYTSFLKEHGVRLFIPDYDLRQILLNNRFKLAITEFYTTAERVLPKIRELQPDLNVVLDTIDVHFAREQTKAELTGDVEDNEEAGRVKCRELATCRNVEAIFTVTSLDKEILLREDSSLDVEVVPNIHRIMFDKTSIERRDKSKLLFVGGFTHAPNVDAVRYLCAEVLPLVHKEYPAAEAVIVGDCAPDKIKALASDKVKILGHVPDMEPYLRASYISVAPLRFGAGMKGKVGEALAYGLPVVTTSIGAQGFELVHEQNIMVADTAEDFAGCICKLMSNSSLYRKLAHNGPEFIRNTCTPEIVGRKLVEFVERSSETLKLKQLDRLNREKWELNFDIFQRYKAAADALEFMRKGRMKVLDVGGRGDLLKFLPDDCAVTVDRTRYFPTRTFAVADCQTLPFRDGAYDFAMAMDVIEHLPREGRIKFLGELGRVASRGIIIGAPFRTALTERGEVIINELHKRIRGSEDPWLAEHIAHQLPELAEATRHLEDAGFSISALPNGYLPHWMLLMGMYYVLIEVADSANLLRTLNEFYNRNYYVADNREPCYRYIVVASKDATPPTIETLYPESCSKGVDARADLAEALGTLPYIETMHFLRNNEALLRETMLQLENREAVILAKDKEIRDRDEVINNLLSKWPVRLYRKLKGILKEVQ